MYVLIDGVYVEIPANAGVSWLAELAVANWGREIKPGNTVKIQSFGTQAR